MNKQAIKLNISGTIREFFKRIAVFLLISSLFWLFAVVAYFEYKTKSNLDKILQTEYEAYSGSLKTINQDTFKESAAKHNIHAVEIYSGQEVVFKSVSQELPPNILSVFNSIGKSSLKDSVLLPSNGNIYLLSLSTFDNKTVKLVKLLSAEEAKELDRDIFTILFIAISSIVLTALISFPLVYMQYKKLLENEKTLLQANLNILNALGKAISKRDNDTYEHNYRVTYYALKIAESYGLDKKQLQGVVKGAFLHDIGKIGISDVILLKPGKLTSDEFEIIKTHVRHGDEIIGSIEWLEDARNIVVNHHEKFDGTGYLDGKSGDEIPIEARIFAVADVFDALTSDRPYKRAYRFEDSIEIIKNGAGSHFDKRVVDIFLSISREIHHDIKDMSKEKLESVIVAYVEKIWGSH
ncbi:MAG: HD-GYP domain-containing protein [Campylobacterales bacterium]